jgi:hypothetical protein
VSDEEAAVFHMLRSPVVVEAVCVHCLVGWPPDEGPNCWVCDKPADNYTKACDADALAKELYKDKGYLRGGPAAGNRYSTEWNDPPDRDHVYALVTRVGTVFQVNRLHDTSRTSSALHRWRRTDEWSNRHRAYVFVYEGEVTPDA